MLQLSQRALTASDADGELFANRAQELAATERALGLGFNVYVSGPSGSGKTSFLQRIKARQEHSIFLNLARVNTIPELIALLAGTLDLPTPGGLFVDALGELLDQHRRLEKLGRDRVGPLRRAVAKQSAPSTLLLDNLDSRLRHELFGRQRDELWQVPLQWVVVGDTPWLDPPVDTFFETSVALEPFTPDAMRELLLRRGRQGDHDQEELMQQIANTLADVLEPATPRRVMSTTRAVFLSPDPDSYVKQLREQRYSYHQLSATARLVLDALYAVGPAHAGNEQLLKQVGATRSRVVQVLRELEDARLVRSVRDGKRKLFAPALGDDRLLENARDEVQRAPRPRTEARS